jgi:hypothetical protein
MPEKTLTAFADHANLDTILTTDAGDAEVTLRQFADSGIEIDALATQVQDDGAKSFVKSWKDLIDVFYQNASNLRRRVVELLNTLALRLWFRNQSPKRNDCLTSFWGCANRLGLYSKQLGANPQHLGSSRISCLKLNLVVVQVFAWYVVHRDLVSDYF